MPTASIQIEGDALLNRCRFHKNGHHLAVGADDGRIRLFELNEVFVISMYYYLSFEFYFILITSQANLLCTVGNDKLILNRQVVSSFCCILIIAFI